MKSNLLASAAFLIGTATACSASQHEVPQRATLEDRTRCSAAFGYYGEVLSDVEDVVYGRRIAEPDIAMEVFNRKILLATEMVERDCASIPDEDVLFKKQLMIITARVQRMQKYLDQRGFSKIK